MNLSLKHMSSFISSFWEKQKLIGQLQHFFFVVAKLPNSPFLMKVDKIYIFLSIFLFRVIGAYPSISGHTLNGWPVQLKGSHIFTPMGKP